MPAVVVKIDNVDAARPQSGVEQADVVYEELVEGGLTRLAAVFQSHYPTLVGPVRSGRLTDEGIIDDLNHPVYAYSGTNGIFLPILRSQPVNDADDGNEPGQFWRTNYAPAPHNLYTSVASLAKLSTTNTAPSPLFAFLGAGQAFSGAGVTPAAGISIGFPSAAIGWSWNAQAGLWMRSQNGTADNVRSGTQLTAANVIVQFVSYYVSIKANEGGVPTNLPTGQLVGTGTVWYLSQGQLVKGTWSRSSLTALTSYQDASGGAIALTPGQTWIELVPVGTTPTITP